MAARYRIGQFADLAGVSVKTLRFYDEIGLLRPASIDSRTRYRYYVAPQLMDLASILALKNLGVSLSNISRATSRMASGQELREVLKEVRRTVDQSVQTAQKSLAWIDSALEGLERRQRPAQVVVKRRPACTVASVRAKVKRYADIEAFERQLLSELPLESRGSLQGVLWHSCADAGFLEGEPFVALKRGVPKRSVYDVKELPAVTAAAAYSGLDNASAEQTYHSIRAWMTAGGYQIAGPKREIYLEGLLEIQFPLQTM
jgi:DNA-binding transcriptional MerR regulator